MSRAQWLRRSGYALCGIGVFVFLADEILPVDLFKWGDSHVYYRLAPGPQIEYSKWAGAILVLLGVAAIGGAKKISEKQGGNGDAT